MKKKLKFLGLLFPLILLGAGFWYWRNVYASPNRILGQAIKKTSQVRSLAYAGEVKTTTASFLGSSFSLSLIGAIDWANPNELKNKSNLTLKSSEVEMAIIEALGVGEKTYFKSTKVSEPLISFGLDPDPLLNKWILLDAKEIFGNTDELAQAEKSDISQEELQSWFDFVKANPPLKVTEKLSDEELDGQVMYHFKYQVDKENLQKVSQRWQEMLNSEEPSAVDQELLAKSLEKMEFQTGEIWIGKKDLLPHKISFGLIDEMSTSTLGLEINLTLKNFNEPVEVTEPTEFLTTTEALKQLDSLFLPR